MIRYRGAAESVLLKCVWDSICSEINTQTGLDDAMIESDTRLRYRSSETECEFTTHTTYLRDRYELFDPV